MKISLRTFRILAVVWGLVWAVLIVGAVHFVKHA